MDPHQNYLELCAEDAAGRLSETEWIELQEHLSVCLECRKASEAYYRLSTDLIPRLGQVYGATRIVDPGRKQQLFEIAKSEGLHLLSQSQKASVLKRPAVLFAAWAASIILAVVVTGILSKRTQNPRPIKEARSVTISTAASSSDTAANRVSEVESLTRQLRATEARLSSLSETSTKRQRELDELELEKKGLTEQLGRLQKSVDESAKESDTARAEIAQLKSDLAQVQSKEEAGRNASLVTEAELRRLRSTAEQQSRQLEEMRRLNVAEHSARDLIGSRNLHVVDFQGWDENGKPQREFGRLLYAEGSCLEFYAFDLDNPQRPKNKAAFYVWAKTRNSTQPVPLGKLNFDSTTDNRWSLKVNDRQALLGIRSVFVTVEPEGTPASEPSGKTIFSASLDRRANHP